MIAYYKLPAKWEQNHQHIVITGPQGLIQTKLCQTLTKSHPDFKPKHLSLLEKQDIESFKHDILALSLFDEKEILFIHLDPKLYPHFPWKAPKSPSKILVVTGLDKLPKSKDHQAFDLTINTYALKEPFLTKEIQQLLNEHQIKLTPKGLRWLALSHQGSEHLIIPTIKRLALTYNNAPIPDKDLKYCIYQEGTAQAFDLIDALLQTQTQLLLRLESLKPDEWIKSYWALISYWRKIHLAAQTPSTLSTHFPWESQQKQAKKLLSSLSISQIKNLHESLLNIEIHFKGQGSENPQLLLQHWCFQAQQSIQAP